MSRCCGFFVPPADARLMSPSETALLVDCFIMKQSIPPTVEDVYEFLKKEITWLHGRWIIFEQLYNKSPARIDLLNEAASTFFYILQRMMLDDLQLSLSKLTDPAPGKGSLKQLQHRLERHGNARLAAQAAEVLRRLVEHVQPFRTWRDKQIAHYDLAVALDQHVEPMPDVYYRELSEALRLVRKYMNLIERHYHDSEQAYEHFIMHSDGDALITMLKFGLRYHELVLQQQISFGDYRESKWSEA